MSILSSKKEKVIMEKGLSSVTTVGITVVLLSIVAAICLYGLNVCVCVCVLRECAHGP